MKYERGKPYTLIIALKDEKRMYRVALAEHKLEAYVEVGVGSRKRLKLVYANDTPYPNEIVPRLKHESGDGYLLLMHPEYETRRLYVDAKGKWTLEKVAS